MKVMERATGEEPEAYGDKPAKDEGAKAQRFSSAMAAGIAARPWTMEDVAALVAAAAPKPDPRGPYRKRLADAAESSN